MQELQIWMDSAPKESAPCTLPFPTLLYKWEKASHSLAQYVLIDGESMPIYLNNNATIRMEPNSDLLYEWQSQVFPLTAPLTMEFVQLYTM